MFTHSLAPFFLRSLRSLRLICEIINLKHYRLRRTHRLSSGFGRGQCFVWRSYLCVNVLIGNGRYTPRRSSLELGAKDHSLRSIKIYLSLRCRSRSRSPVTRPYGSRCLNHQPCLMFALSMKRLCQKTMLHRGTQGHGAHPKTAKGHDMTSWPSAFSELTVRVIFCASSISWSFWLSWPICIRKFYTWCSPPFNKKHD